jgi:hypothetical protein
MKPEGVIYSVFYQESRYLVFFPHDFNKYRSEPDMLVMDGVIIFDENFVEIDSDKYEEFEKYIVKMLG